MTRTFNVIDEPVLPAVWLDGTSADISIRQALIDAHRIAAIEGEPASMTFALHRLLLAIVYRALPVERPRQEWRELWDAPELPAEDLNSYLDDWYQRFDLLDPAQPWLQVAGLHTTRSEFSELEKLIPDIPNGEQFFTVRAGLAARSISLAEAARYLIHAQAFDPSGIKSGAVGDPRVKGGKGYPIGTAWAGNLGGVLVQGRTLKETLLLNLTLGSPNDDDRPWSGEEDQPVWEREPLTAAEEFPGETTGDIPGRAPRGPADLLTWPSRRMRLRVEADRVTGVLIANGDVLWPQNRHAWEPMTAWRRSDPQSKKYKTTVYMPRQHDADRSFWRGAGAVLPRADRSHHTVDGETGLPAASLRWLQGAVDDVLGPNFVLRARAISVIYGSNSSVIDAVYDDTMVVPAAVLDHPDLQQGLIDAIAHTDKAVQALGDLGRDLEQAAGGVGDALRGRARQLGFHRLDEPFRRWMGTLVSGSNLDAAVTQWFVVARRDLVSIGLALIDAAPPEAWTGRPDPRRPDRRLDVVSAERRFHWNLAAALPTAPPVSEPTAESGARP
ncbi:type I-E CRISPR-associated protein Cse1/CasA [Nakamurella multipartita]|uniref:CRISPR-associated protein, Cse1 family n=1 Tax=Nakamurella multipartita (strain ATCC 700099 / DSM 44233 / CIP 104796 / JCM 9543 / NBRC 105858 / Y-104) TaxID=479431 RepID=C8XAY7_NAKMY|nr:type I-E CRISPR-associated protein Cse1/CasA [Nakamurella multipartita]ACV79390.1 CRISPR-associated protein, Cse1 family [Nakamurella multipartita DSM 44233]